MRNADKFQAGWGTIIFFIFIVAFVSSSIVSSVAATEPLRMLTVEMAPFGFFTKDDKYTGLLYEIANRIAIETGLSHTNSVVPLTFPKYGLKY